MDASVDLLYSLVREATTPLRGEKMTTAIHRVARDMGVSVRSVEAWHYGRRGAAPSEVGDYCDRASIALRARLVQAEADLAALRARIALLDAA